MKRKVPVILSMLLAAGITATPAMTAYAAPSFNPYKTVQAEAKFGDSGIEITTEESGATVVSSIDKGDYFFVKDVNFAQGLSKITISAKTAGPAVIEVRKGGADGEVLGNIKLTDTNGEYKDFSAAMKNVEGKDTITFVGAAGTVSIDYWTAEAAQTTEPQPENPQPENPEPENPQPENPTVTVNPYAAVEAESAQDKYFAADLSKDGVNYLGIKANGYIVFKDVDFSNGAAGLVANAKSDRPNTALELHIDSLDSQALTSVKIKSMSAFGESAQEFTSDITGKHDVYLVAKTGTVNLDSWYITPATTTTPEEPTPEEPQPENPVVTDPYSDFQAEAANVKEAATDATAGDATYTSIKANGYIAFKDVDLTKGISGVMLNAKSAAPNTTVDVRVDGVDGQSLGKVKIMSMGAFKNAAVKIDSTLTGKHDLYLVVTNGVADIDSLKLLPGKTTP
ncbi:carbohydrate-binding protein, partial [Pseudobutyrivibrio sp.]|uniref:carbohydrate-binding protein n=1 Tax=Pseudobutyrivibrio sp. TaxID=2014367 RepID=UPI0025DC7F1A